MKDKNHIRRDFTFCHIGHAPGLGLWGAWGAQGGQKQFFFKHGHVAYQIDGYHVNFNFLYQTLCVFSQIKNRNHIEQNFHSVAWIIPQGVGLGCAGGG